MRPGAWFLLLLAVVLLASTALPRDLPPPCRPDLFLILAVCAALRAPHGRDGGALALCWMTGLAKDLFSAGPLGQYALLHLIAGAAILRIRSAFDERSAFAGAVLACAAALAAESAAAWILGRDGASLRPARGAFRGVLTAALVTGVVAFPIFLALNRIGRRLGPGKKRSLKYVHAEAAE